MLQFYQLSDRIQILILTGIIHDLDKLGMPRLGNLRDRLSEIGLKIVPLGDMDGLEAKIKDAEAIMKSNHNYIDKLENRLAQAKGIGQYLKEELHSLTNLLRTNSTSTKEAGDDLYAILCKYQFTQI